jgi:hypothetical protein
MARAAIALLAGLLLPACGDGNGSSGAGAGTLAYLASSCRRVSPTEETVQQELRVVRGDETTTVYPVGPLGPFESFGACVARGQARRGIINRFGAFQRIGMLPDGSGIVFELNDEHYSAAYKRDLLPAEERGMYYVRSDGTGLRRLGPPSRFPAVHDSPASGTWFHNVFKFPPGGGLFTYGDLGPDEDGQEAPQVFVRDVHTGVATQLTRLPPIPDAEGNPEIYEPEFIDARTILFRRFVELPDRGKYVSVDLDGEAKDVDRIVPLPDGTLITIPVITSGEWSARLAIVSGEAENPAPLYPSPTEVFITDGTNVLQLTNYKRVDTASGGATFSPFDGRVYFNASADPLGTNPSYDCQIFSVDPISRDTRQVTFFHEEGNHQGTRGCFGGGCRVNTPEISSATGTLYFSSQCDPRGQNPQGWQVFSIEPNGSGLRQLTYARGFVRFPDGRHEAETVDGFTHAPYD